MEKSPRLVRRWNRHPLYFALLFSPSLKKSLSFESCNQTKALTTLLIAVVHGPPRFADIK